MTLGWEEMISDDDDVPEAVPLGSMQDTLRVCPSVSRSVCLFVVYQSASHSVSGVRIFFHEY